MTKGKEAGRIQVYVRVRPFTEKEREKKEINAIALHHDHSLIRVLDPRRDTNYFFDGVFGPESSNYELYLKVGRPLVYAALNGYKGTLLTYGQTGTGKTYTLLSEDGVTTNVVNHCFERIQDDTIHSYKVTCSFLQVYQEKVYDLLNPRFTVELPVREHPKKGVYVGNLTQNEVKCAGDVLALLEFGKRQLVMAETKMVRHSSRSHSIMQLIIERRLKAHIAMEQASTEELGPKSPETVHDSIMAVDETINNLLKELKQDRKAHHRVNKSSKPPANQQEQQYQQYLQQQHKQHHEQRQQGQHQQCLQQKQHKQHYQQQQQNTYYNNQHQQQNHQYRQQGQYQQHGQQDRQQHEQRKHEQQQKYTYYHSHHNKQQCDQHRQQGHYQHRQEKQQHGQLERQQQHRQYTHYHSHHYQHQQQENHQHSQQERQQPHRQQQPEQQQGRQQKSENEDALIKQSTFCHDKTIDVITI